MKRSRTPCISHRKYKAIYRPRCNCLYCWTMWERKQFLLKPKKGFRFYYYCSYRQGTGDDREGCSYKSRRFNTVKKCMEAATNHNHTHRPHWGYPSEEWWDSQTCIVAVKGTKEITLGHVSEVAGRGKEE